jgi:hypothetical protein
MMGAIIRTGARALRRRGLRRTPCAGRRSTCDCASEASGCGRAREDLNPVFVCDEDRAVRVDVDVVGSPELLVSLPLLSHLAMKPPPFENLIEARPKVAVEI